uniref:DUF4283 domain-containing protein n=1 Tax=Nicotiana tabacum TaxID=4097 RepID=A0A1S3YB41_TOBAC|nr:PREDICTED: uncharacterized protein LOC107774419 [Nicotiana tabacum]
MQEELGKEATVDQIEATMGAIEQVALDSKVVNPLLGSDALSKIASAIGKPLFADECTTKQTRIFYARMLIEVNVTKAMPTEIMVMDPRGRVFQQDLVYEWKPVYCDKCQEKTQHCLPVETRQSNHNQSEGGIENNGAAAIDKGKKQVGINKWYKRKELKNYLKTKNIKFAGMIETRVKEQKAKGVSHHIAPGWEILYNYNVAVNGRIWVIWDTSYYSVKLIKAEAHVIHCVVKDIRKDHEYAVSIVYGFNAVEKRKQLWENLIEIDQMTSIPWVIGGILMMSYNCKIGCMEIQIWSRIGKIFGNYEWMMQWRHISTVYKMPFISDDAPMSLTFNDNQRSRKTPFNFFNVWADHERFLTDVQQIWQ